MSTNHWPTRAPVLASYAYVGGSDKKVEALKKLVTQNNAQLFIDSGAFSAATLGITVNIHEYTQWLLDNQNYLHQAAVLDVIGDWKATAANHEYMLNRIGDALTILPAWHLGSPETELRRLCKTYPYVAIGGCVPYTKRPNVLMAHLVKTHRVAREYGTKLHGLGITGNQTLNQLPWHTVDSSSWGSGPRYGAARLVDDRGRAVNVQLGQGKLTPHQIQVIRAYDGDPTRIMSREFCMASRTSKKQYELDRKWLYTAAARATWVRGELLQKKHKTDLLIYLAEGNVRDIANAVEGHSRGNPFTKRNREAS